MTLQFENYAVYGLVAYWGLFVVLPKIVGELLLSQSNIGYFQVYFGRPRTPEIEAEIRGKVTAQTWHWYKRLEGLRDGYLEEFPLYLVVVVLGSIAFKEKSYFNDWSAVYFALLIAHAYLHLTGTSSRALGYKVFFGLAAHGALYWILWDIAKEMQEKMILFI